jgi:hypothetical protein
METKQGTLNHEILELHEPGRELHLKGTAARQRAETSWTGKVIAE